MNPEFEFLDMIPELDNGLVKTELDDALRAVMLASAQIGGKGSISLTLNFSTKIGKGARTKVVADVKYKAPRVQTEATSFYVSEKGALLREDPRQMKLEFEADEDAEDEKPRGKQRKVVELPPMAAAKG